MKTTIEGSVASPQGEALFEENVSVIDFAGIIGRSAVVGGIVQKDWGRRPHRFHSIDPWRNRNG